VSVEQDKDKQDIMWGLGSGMDFLAVSFCQSAADVRYVREFLGRQANNVKIIAKIENQQGVDEIEDIISEADGVMVARGDLGMEVPLEKLINIQVRFLPVFAPS
jgi:pyruvate kinase